LYALPCKDCRPLPTRGARLKPSDVHQIKVSTGETQMLMLRNNLCLS
jgi:hypothetical protein